MYIANRRFLSWKPPVSVLENRILHYPKSGTTACVFPELLFFLETLYIMLYLVDNLLRGIDMKCYCKYKGFAQ